jgi:hypothetical protein
MSNQFRETHRLNESAPDRRTGELLAHSIGSAPSTSLSGTRVFIAPSHHQQTRLSPGQPAAVVRLKLLARY